jgi:membrane fusion protein (multidrug efflux system)
MKRKIILASFAILLVVGALAGIKIFQIRAMIAAGKAFGPPAATVSSFVSREEKWQDTLTAVGSISAEQGVTVSPEIAGTVSEIAFDSGAVVAKGDLLVRLDTSLEEAQLRSAEAQVELARLDAERIRQLRTNNIISQSDLDTTEATLKENIGNADAIRATIAKKTIRAPFAGRLGIRLVNLGELLEVGKSIVSLQSLSPIHADFSLPQQNLAQIKTGQTVRVLVDTYPDKKFEGVLTAINPDVDSTTRNVRLRATLENREQLLQPGMFARMEVILPTEQTVQVIPATAVLSATYGDSVYVIEPKTGATGTNVALVVRQQFVRTGTTHGDFVSVLAGLKVGERVVGSGLFKLHNGMAVQENNELVPKASEKPSPSDS